MEINNLMLHSKIGIAISILAIVYSVKYLYRNYYTIDVQLRVAIYVFVFCLIFVIYDTIDSSESFNKLTANYSLSTGKIVQYFVPRLKGGIPSRGIAASTNYIRYTYNVDSTKIENAYGPNYRVDVPDVKPDLNMEYLVVYQIGNPKNSFILLNYPIVNETDIEKYKRLFADGIPDSAIKQH